MKRALAAAGLVVLGLLAVAGVALSIAYTLVSTDLGRGLLVPRLVRLADDALAGRIELKSFHLLAGGGIELVGVRVVGPDDEVVLRVDRARVGVDLSRIRSKALGFRAELQGVAAVLKREPDGSLSIARAFAPTHPSTGPSKPLEWTLRLLRLTLRDGSVRYVDGLGHTAFEADGLAADGRAIYGPRGAGVDLALRGTMMAPERAPIALDALARLREKEVRLRVLRASAGDTALDAAGTFDLGSWRGRVAVLSLAVDPDHVRSLVPGAPLAGAVTGTAFAESDGTTATAAVELRPRQGGAADGAAALRLPPGSPAGGVELHLAGLDLSRLLRGAPATALTADLRGHAAGQDRASLRGAAELSLASSRLRSGRLGPVELRAGTDRGAVEVTRLDATVAGATLRGRGRWRPGGELSGQATLDAPDAAQLRQELERLLARQLPPVSGSLLAEAQLSGTERAPVLALRLTAPALAASGVSAAGVALAGTVSGPLASPRAQVEGTAARVAMGGNEARTVKLIARLEGRRGEVDLTGAVPELGPEAVELSGAGALSPDGRVVAVSALTLSWPGDRFVLEEPARITLAGPAVDRLALAAGRQRVVVSGGISGPARRRSVDARAQLTDLDLALLPRALLPPRLGLAGRLTLDARVRGSLEAPQVSARLELADGAAVGLEGLSAAAEAGYDGARRRARLDLTARRAAGGELAVRGEVPVAFARAAASAPVDATITARSWPVSELLRLARARPEAAVDGLVGLEASLRGTVAAPRLEAALTVAGGRYADLEPLGATVRLEGAGAEATLRASLDYRAARALDVEAKVPLRTSALLRAPGPTLRRVGEERFTAVATVPGLDLAGLAGRLDLPADLRGRLTMRVEVAGTAREPRGAATAALADVTYAGYRGLAAQLEVTAASDATALEGAASIEGERLASITASLALPVERLGRREERERAAVAARLEIPGIDLRRAGVALPLSGELAGTASLRGTLAAPRIEADLRGRGLQVAGRPLGDLTARARAADGRSSASVQLAAAAGGTLDATLDAEADVGLPALRRGELARAPARATLVASQLDLGFLPAVAPGVIRSASGKLGADVVAAGPLRRMVPRGTVVVAGGKASVAEFGEWTDVTVQASLSEDAFKVDRLAARRRDGKLELTAEAKGLARRNAPADFQVTVRTEGLPIPRGGQDLATVDVEARASGTVSATELLAEVTVPGATVRLPNRLPRRIQPLEPRPDIVIGRPRPAPRAAAAAEGEERAPYHARVHLVVPGRFFVKGDSPRANVELKADVTADRREELSLQGDVDVVRGQVEPIGGRIFDLKRGRVHFTGGGYEDAVLEVQAVYDNPAAKVTVAVSGTVQKPEIKLSSEPPMDESQIALLIATGRTELKAGSGGVGTLTGEQAGYAALGAVATQLFKDVLADKLPLDSVSLDSSQLRAGKYVTDKIYVGYTRRFNAKLEEGENTNEVRVEYQITPRWTFQTTYGDAQTGGASLIWSKDY